MRGIIVWEATLDGRFEVFVERTGFDGYSGQLVIKDGEEEILRERTGLMYGAAFGPDVGDVARWQGRAVEVINERNAE